jgi:hypothetical protein
VLGGIRIPNVPPAATQPVESVSAYPCVRISGVAMVPIVAVVAAREPQMAPNPAQAAIVAQARPPGSQLSHYCLHCISLC